MLLLTYKLLVSRTSSFRPKGSIRNIRMHIFIVAVVAVVVVIVVVK